MQITDSHKNVLRAIHDAQKTGQSIFNRADAEECVELGLLEPNPGQGRGYTLTEKGRAQL